MPFLLVLLLVFKALLAFHYGNASEEKLEKAVLGQWFGYLQVILVVCKTTQDFYCYFTCIRYLSTS
jgi:hypothetical protein